MANVDRPSGFRPIGTVSGAPWQGHLMTFDVDSSNATAIFLGDLIALEADGNVAPAAAGSTQLLGACVGIYHSDPGDSTGRSLEGGGSNDLNLSLKYLPANTAGKILVTVGPDVLYEAQEDSAVSSLALTDRGANVDFVAGAGSTTTGRSGYEIDSDTVTTIASAPLRIVDIVRREDNEVGTNAKWIVRIHTHHFSAANGV